MIAVTGNYTYPEQTPYTPGPGAHASPVQSQAGPGASAHHAAGPQGRPGPELAVRAPHQAYPPAGAEPGAGAAASAADAGPAWRARGDQGHLSPV